MSVLLGFSGKIGSGKSTACELLHEVADVQASEHIEFSDSVIKLANGWLQKIGQVENIGHAELEGLREATREAFSTSLSLEAIAPFDGTSLRPYLAAYDCTAEITTVNKDAHRPLLQWLGHQFSVHVDSEFWNTTIENRVITSQRNGVDLITIGGVRYPANANLIHDLQGQVIEVVRPAYEDNKQEHVSERGLHEGYIDHYVMNNGSVKELGEAMLTLWNTITATSP